MKKIDILADRVLEAFILRKRSRFKLLRILRQALQKQTDARRAA